MDDDNEEDARRQGELTPGMTDPGDKDGSDSTGTVANSGIGVGASQPHHGSTHAIVPGQVSHYVELKLKEVKGATLVERGEVRLEEEEMERSKRRKEEARNAEGEE